MATLFLCNAGSGTSGVIGVSNARMGWDSEALNFVVVLVGVVLSLRKMAQMERYHAVRVIVFTVVLSCIAIYIYEKSGVFGEPVTCLIEIKDDGVSY